VAILAVLAVAAVAAACSDSDSSGSASGSESSSNSGHKVYTQRDTDITVANEHAFVVALPVTSGTGYEWEAVTVPDLQQMTTEQVQGANRPGATATQQITFRAQATGSGTQHTTLTLNYARPWEDGVPPAKTASFDVTITN
jgi:predicted secreted protein